MQAVKIETALDVSTVELEPAALQAIGDLLNASESDRRGLYVHLRQQATGYRFMTAMLNHQGKPKDIGDRAFKFAQWRHPVVHLRHAKMPSERPLFTRCGH